MKVTIELNLPEDNRKLKLITKSEDLYLSLLQIRAELTDLTQSAIRSRKGRGVNLSALGNTGIDPSEMMAAFDEGLESYSINLEEFEKGLWE